MTQEEKARAYDEVREKIAIRFGSNVAEEIFSQFEMSEDERIRKEIIYHIKNCDDTIDEKTEKRMIVWLEKQGEQKPAEWHREDEQNLNACLGYIPDEFLRRWLQDAIYAEYENPAWSKEDERMMMFCCDYLDDNQKSWLLSLKERYTWKPSDEQIKVCKEVYADILSAKGFDLGTINSELNRLEEELKKLKEA